MLGTDLHPIRNSLSLQCQLRRELSYYIYLHHSMATFPITPIMNLGHLQVRKKSQVDLLISIKNFTKAFVYFLNISVYSSLHSE
jgi:hypothetical protein